MGKKLEKIRERTLRWEEGISDSRSLYVRVCESFGFKRIPFGRHSTVFYRPAIWKNTYHTITVSNKYLKEMGIK